MEYQSKHFCLLVCVNRNTCNQLCRYVYFLILSMYTLDSRFIYKRIIKIKYVKTSKRKQSSRALSNLNQNIKEMKYKFHKTKYDRYLCIYLRVLSKHLPKHVLNFYHVLIPYTYPSKFMLSCI